jgi:hypothetical protein
MTNTASWNLAGSFLRSRLDLAPSLARLSSGSGVAQETGTPVPTQWAGQIGRDPEARANLRSADPIGPRQIEFLPHIEQALDRMSEWSVLPRDTTPAESDLVQRWIEFPALANLRAQLGVNLEQLRLTAGQLRIPVESPVTPNRRAANADAAHSSAEFDSRNLLARTGAAILVQAARSADTGVPATALRLRTHIRARMNWRKRLGTTKSAARPRVLLKLRREQHAQALMSLAPAPTPRFRSENDMEAA